MATIDASIVIIAMPAIFRGIDLNPLTPGNVTYLLWMIIGYLLVQSVLVVTLGRLGDIFGRVRIYNLGFVVFTLAASIALASTRITAPAARCGSSPSGWSRRSAARCSWPTPPPSSPTPSPPTSAAWRWASTRSPASPASSSACCSAACSRSGTGAWSSGSTCRSGCSAPSGPTSACASSPSPARRASTGPATSSSRPARALLLTAITFGIRPYGTSATGWGNPLVIAGLAGGVALLALFCFLETKIADPMFRMGAVPHPRVRGGQHRQPARRDRPRRPAVHARHLAGGHLAAAARLRLRRRPRCGRASTCCR